MEADMVCLCDKENPTEYLERLKKEYLLKTHRLEKEQQHLEQKILQVEQFLSNETTNAVSSTNAYVREVPKVFPKYQDTPTREKETLQVPKIITESQAEPCGFFQKFKSMLSISKCTTPDIHDPPTRENDQIDQASGPLTSQYNSKSVKVQHHGDASRSSSLVCNCNESDESTSRDVSDSDTSCLTCVCSGSKAKDTNTSKTQTPKPYEVQIKFSNKEFSKTSHSQTPKSVDKKTPDGDVKLCQCDSSFVDDRKLGVDIFASPISVDTKVGPDSEPKSSCSANRSREEKEKAKRLNKEKEQQKTNQETAPNPQLNCSDPKCPLSLQETHHRKDANTLMSNRNLAENPAFCLVNTCPHQVKRTRSEQVGTQNLPQIDTSTGCTVPSATNADVQASATSKSKGVDAPDSGKLENKSVPSCNIKTCPSKTRSAQCAFVGSPMLRPKDFNQTTGNIPVETNIELERPKTPQRSKSCDCRTAKTGKDNQMFDSKHASSLPNQALNNMKDITALTAKEKMLQEQLAGLREKEKSYNETSKNAEDILNQSSCICGSNNNAPPKNATDLENEIKKVSNELRIENNILKSDLMEMKLQLRHTLENIEGPVKQKLETEKLKCECLQDELNEASKSLILSQDSYQREMNCLKMQLCIACTNISELNQMNERLKNEMKQLDCLCNKLEDDLIKQKLNEADTIKRLTSRKPYGAGEGPSTNEFNCPSDLESITRQLSITLKEVPCSECTNIPKELRGAAKCIKDLADMVLNSKKAGESASCICKNGTSRGDFQEPKGYGCSCQSMADIPEEVECDCDCCCGGDANAQRSKRSTEEKTVKTLHPAPADFAKQEESSTLNVDNEQSKFFSTTSQQPCADIGMPCLKGTEAKPVERISAPCDEIDRPCSKAAETQIGDTKDAFKPCDDIGKSMDKDEKQIPKKSNKECTAPCSKDQGTLTDKEKTKIKASDSDTESIGNTVKKIIDNLPLEEDQVGPTDQIESGNQTEATKLLKSAVQTEPTEQIEPIDQVEPADQREFTEKPKNVEIKGSLSFNEQRFGDFPFDVTTKVEAIDEPPQGLHVTTTITGSGTLEVITEGPEGTIETTLTYTDEGNIEVVTEVIDHKDQKTKEMGATLLKESSEMPPLKVDSKRPEDKLKPLPVDSSMFSGPSPNETPFSASQATPTDLTSRISSFSQAEPLGGTSTLTGSAVDTKITGAMDEKGFADMPSTDSRIKDDFEKLSIEKSSHFNVPKDEKGKGKISRAEFDPSQLKSKMDYADETETGEMTGEEILSSELTSHPDIANQVGSVEKPSEKHIGFVDPIKESEEIKHSEEIIEKNTYYEEESPSKRYHEEIPTQEIIEKISTKDVSSHAGIEAEQRRFKRSAPGTESEPAAEIAVSSGITAQNAEQSVPGKQVEPEEDVALSSELPTQGAESTERPRPKRSVPGKEDEPEEEGEITIDHPGQEVEITVSLFDEKEASIRGEPDHICTEPEKVTETEPSPPVTKHIDCSCQSKDQKDQSCQCCECKEVGITTSGDKETTTDERKTMGHTPEDHTQDSDSEFITISETTEHALAEDQPKQSEETEDTTTQPTTEGVVSAEIQPEQVGDYLPIQDFTVVPIEDEEPPENLREPSEAGSTDAVSPGTSTVKKKRQVDENVLSKLVGKSSAEQHEILKELGYSPSSTETPPQHEKIKTRDDLYEKHPELAGKTSEEQQQMLKSLGYEKPVEKKGTKIFMDESFMEKHPELAGKTSEEQQQILKELNYEDHDLQKSHKVTVNKEMLETHPELAGKSSGEKSHRVTVNKEVLEKHPELTGKSSEEQQKILEKLGYQAPTKEKSHKLAVNKEVLEKHPELAGKSSEEQQTILKELGYKAPAEEKSHKVTVDRKVLEKHPELAGKSSKEQQKILKELGYQAPAEEKSHKITVDKGVIEKHPELIGKSSEEQQEILKELGYTVPSERKSTKIKVDDDILSQNPELVDKSSEEQQKILKDLGYASSEKEISEEECKEEFVTARQSRQVADKMEDEPSDVPKQPPKQIAVTQDLLGEYPELNEMPLDEQMEYLRNMGVLPAEILPIDEETLKKHLEGKPLEEQREILRKLSVSRGISDESRSHLQQLLLGLVEFPESEETEAHPTVDKSISCRAICRTQATVYDESPPTQHEETMGDVAEVPSFVKTHKTSSRDIPISTKTSATCKASCKTVTISDASVSAAKSTEKSRTVSTQERPRSVEESASCRASCRTISVQGSTQKIKESGQSPEQKVEELVPARKKESTTSSSSDGKDKEKKEKKRGPEEVPSIVSQLSDKDLGPPVDRPRGKPRKKRSAQKSLCAIKCDCGDICRCIICAPDVMERRAGPCACGNPQNSPNLMTPFMMPPQQQQEMLMMMQQMQQLGYPGGYPMTSPNTPTPNEHPIGCTCRECECRPCTPCRPSTPDRSQRSECSAAKGKPEKKKPSSCGGKCSKIPRKEEEPVSAPQEEEPVFVPRCDCPGGHNAPSPPPDDKQFRCHTKDCECVDCLTMPKIKKLALTKEYPVVYDKKQVYQVKCDCENAQNAKAFVRSRIPVPIRSQAQQVGTEASRTQQQADAIPSKTQQPSAQASRTQPPSTHPSRTHSPSAQPSATARPVPSQPVAYPSMPPIPSSGSDISACDCAPCLCQNCADPSIPRRIVEPCPPSEGSKVQVSPSKQVQESPSRPVQTSPSRQVQTSPSKQVQISPSQLSPPSQPLLPSQQEPEAHTPDCTCGDCTKCPGSEMMKQAMMTEGGPPSQKTSQIGPPSKTQSKTGPPSKSQSKTDPLSGAQSKTGPPSKTQSKTEPLSGAQSKTSPLSKTQSKTGPPSQKQSEIEPLEEEFEPCTCDDPCDCPGEKPAGGEGDVPCTCDDPCDCPGEKPAPKGEKTARPVPSKGSVKNLEDCECNECDCPGLKPEPSVTGKPSATEKPLATGTPSVMVTGKPSVHIRPPDDHKSSLDEGHPEDCVCDLCTCPGLKEALAAKQPSLQEAVPSLHKTDPSLQKVSSKQPMGDGCIDCQCCNICECPGRTNLLKKVPSVKSSHHGGMEPIPEVPVEVPCDCADCKCNPCADPRKRGQEEITAQKSTMKQPPTEGSKMKMEGSVIKVDYPSSDCDCEVCKCSEEILHTDEPTVTDSKAGVEIETDPQKENVGVNFPEKVLHPSNCDCEECTCLEDIIQTESCKCRDCLCSECPLESRTHHDRCYCDQCICFSCDYNAVGQQVGDEFISAKTSQVEKPVSGEPEAPQGMGDQTPQRERYPDECTCDDCICVESKDIIRQHSDECVCDQCICVAEGEIPNKPSVHQPASAKPSAHQPPSTKPSAHQPPSAKPSAHQPPSAKPSVQKPGGDTQGVIGENCTCDTCLCIDCAGKQLLESRPPDDTYCHCPTCKCDPCSRQRDDKEVSPKSDEKISNDKAVESVEDETVVEVDDKLLSAKPSVRAGETQVDDLEVQQDDKEVSPKPDEKISNDKAVEAVEEEDVVEVDDKLLSAKPSVRVDETQIGEPYQEKPSKTEMGTVAKPITPKVSAQTHPIDCDCPICYSERGPVREQSTQHTVTAQKSAGDLKRAVSQRSGVEVRKIMSAKASEHTSKKPSEVMEGVDHELIQDQDEPTQAETAVESKSRSQAAIEAKSRSQAAIEAKSRSQAAIEAKSRSKAAIPEKQASKAGGELMEGSSFKLLPGMSCNCQTPCDCAVCPRLEGFTEQQKSNVAVGTKSQSKVAVTQKSSVRIREPSGTQIEEQEIGHTPAQGSKIQQEFVDQAVPEDENVVKQKSRTHPDECICDVCVCVAPEDESAVVQQKSSVKMEQQKSSAKVSESAHGMDCNCETCNCTPGVLGQVLIDDVPHEEVDTAKKSVTKVARTIVREEQSTQNITSETQFTQTIPSEGQVIQKTVSQVRSTQKIKSEVQFSEVAENIPSEREVIQKMPSEVRSAQKMQSQGQVTEKMPSKAEVGENTPSERQLVQKMPSEVRSAQKMQSQGQVTEKMPSKPEVGENIPSERQLTQKMPSEVRSAQKMQSQGQVTEKMPSRAEVGENIPSERQLVQKMPSEVQSAQKMQSQGQVTEKMPSRAEVGENIPSERQLAQKMPSEVRSAQKMQSQGQVTEKMPSRAEVGENIPSQRQLVEKMPSEVRSAQKMQSQGQVDENIPDEEELDQKLPSEAKIKKMPSSTIKQEIEKHVDEKCKCKDEIMEILKALQNIRCSCDEAELTMAGGRPYTSQIATGIDAVPAVASHATSVHMAPSARVATSTTNQPTNAAPSIHAVSAHSAPSESATPAAIYSQTTTNNSTRKVQRSAGAASSTDNQQGGGGKMFVKKASDFGQTMSGLKIALQNLQQNCKMKDRMIAAMTGELEARGEDVDYDKVLDFAKISPHMEYDMAGDIKSNDTSQLVSTVVMHNVENKDQGTEPIRNVSSKAVEVRTHKHRKKCTNKCEKNDTRECNVHQIIQKDEINCQRLELKGFEVTDVRRITEDSLIVKWLSPGYDFIAGYDIFINGTLASKVMSGSRTSAMIHSLDLSKSIQITIYAVTKCGRCEPPAIAIYEIKS